jgi:putative phosphoesterase
MRSFTHRIGVLGDVHCEDALVSAALTFFEAQKVEAILCVGDIVDGPGDASRTLGLLRQASVEAVCGNHERWCLSDTMRGLPDATPADALPSEHRAWLEELPPTREYATPKGSMLLCHGLGSDDMSSFRPDDSGDALESNAALQKLVREHKYSLVLSGHSHRRMVRELGGIIFVNAGTLFRQHLPCVMLLDFEANAARYFDWKSDKLVEAESLKL